MVVQSIKTFQLNKNLSYALKNSYNNHQPYKILTGGGVEYLKQKKIELTPNNKENQFFFHKRHKCSFLKYLKTIYI